jgi:hypothetical protein
VKNRIATLIASGSLVVASVGAGVAFPGHAVAGKGASVQTNDVVIFESSYPGQAIRYEGGSHDNDVSVDIGATSIVIVDNNAVGLSTNSPCTLDSSTQVTCPKTNGGSLDSDKVFNVTIKTNDGNDTLVSTGTGTVSGSSQPIKVTLTGFGGDDTATATGGYSYVIGGDGDDILTSGPGTSGYSEYVYGNAGNDTIYTDGSSTDLDRIYCDNNLDLGYTDTVYKENQDIIMGYPHWPPPALSSGCDTVYSS